MVSPNWIADATAVSDNGAGAGAACPEASDAEPSAKKAQVNRDWWMTLRALVECPLLLGTMLPVSLGIKQDSVPLALEFADLVYVARKSRELPRLAVTGGGNELV